MATRDFSKYFLYRWRYVIGYSLVGVLLAGLLLFAGLYLPGGISEQEMNSVVRSASLSLTDPSSLAIANMPYYAFQAGVFALFGVSIFTIKLPSLILGLLSAIGLIMLLRRWFKPNIAVLASLIAVSTGQFLFISQLGTPSILYIFWPILLLLLGTQVTRGKKLRLLWKTLFAITAALSLYTPLSIYPLIAIGLAILLHPHLRAAVRKLKKGRVAFVSTLFIVLVAPLVYFIGFVSPGLGLTILGLPQQWPPDFAANALVVLKQYFLFWDPSTTTVLTPVFGLGTALLILLGAYRLIRTRETTRSYLIIIWIICLTPVLIINPAFTSVTFVPSILMLAAGLMSLIGYWYRLFPLNPYARIGGLLPIMLLVVTLILTGLDRYIYGYHYSPGVAGLYSNDLRLLPKDTSQLVVADNERAFFEAVASFNRDFTVVSKPTDDSFVVTRNANRAFKGAEVTQIITNSRSADSNRFYVYQIR